MFEQHITIMLSLLLFSLTHLLVFAGYIWKKNSSLTCIVYVLVRIHKDSIGDFVSSLLGWLIINEHSITSNVFTHDTVPLFEQLQPPAS